LVHQCFEYTNGLFKTCRNGHIAIVKYLIEHGVDVNKENNNDESPLYFAFMERQEDIVKYLVEQGANINKKFINDNTLLLKVFQEEYYYNEMFSGTGLRYR